MKAIALVLIVAIACFAAGCGSSPGTSASASKPQVPVASGNTFIVPTPKTTVHPNVFVIGDIPGVQLFRIARNDFRRSALDRGLTQQGFDLVGEFRDGLAAELKKAGGAAPVSTLNVARKKSDNRFEADPRELPAGPAGACFVDAFIIYGFAASVLGADYKPYMVVRLKIFRGGDHSLAYAEKFVYNYLGQNIEVAPSAPLASWKDGAAIEADIPGARDGLRAAIGDVTRFIGTHLKTSNRLDKC
jgi:hypothetical protein